MTLVSSPYIPLKGVWTIAHILRSLGLGIQGSRIQDLESRTSVPRDESEGFRA